LDAKKATLQAPAALALARAADHLYVAKGKKIVHVDMRREKPDDAALLALILGPTGNLRAPTLRSGKTLIVGFDANTYRELLA
jgi:arsenate reductase-like glutaredoxin family protein